MCDSKDIQSLIELIMQGRDMYTRMSVKAKVFMWQRTISYSSIVRIPSSSLI